MGLNRKKVYIETIGCQMNVYDSERIAQALRSSGYEQTGRLDAADLVVMNTCAIRDKAEQKVYSYLGRLWEEKKKKPDLLIGVGGCVAQQEGRKILQRISHVDFVFGTHAIPRLPLIVSRVAGKRERVVDVGPALAGDAVEPAAAFSYESSVSRFVTIMQGCDNFCTYCVVPYVRGRETSRTPDDIVREVTGYVKNGTREITLLGQNVNSYGKKEKLCSFTELLTMIHEISGLERIRFTTSHPKDLSEDLMHAFAGLEKLCTHLHLPVQSGSDEILKKMNRKYTRNIYLEKTAMLRRICPEISLTTDIIVGFPGETEDDFRQTLDLIQSVEYDSLYAFKYSDRPNAPASRIPDKISEAVKSERLQRVLELQEQYTAEKHAGLIGKDRWVLVEGLSKRHRQKAVFQEYEDPFHCQWSGRDAGNKVVNFILKKSDLSYVDNLRGALVKVKIEKARSHSLWGKAIRIERPDDTAKGGKSHAA